MEYLDKDGKKTEIAYSTQVQMRVEKALLKNAHWRKKIFETLNFFKWMSVVIIILGILLFVYFDSRGALTYLGQKFFCGY